MVVFGLVRSLCMERSFSTMMYGSIAIAIAFHSFYICILFDFYRKSGTIQIFSPQNFPL